MARVSVMTLEKARPVGSDSLEYFGDGQPIHLHVQSLKRDAELRIAASAVDSLVYVREGEVEAGGRRLARGAVIIVERDAETVVTGVADQSALLLFKAAIPSDHARSGGHVHLLPRDLAPQVANLSASGVSGTIFANAQCPSCEVWLHENRFPKPGGEPINPEAGIHSHTEDEVIFVTGGQMRLGQKLVGPGTAIAIQAGTFYSFQPGPEGLTFINFRAALPKEIHFADGRTADEVGVWSRVDRPLEYLSPAG